MKNAALSSDGHTNNVKLTNNIQRNSPPVNGQTPSPTTNAPRPQLIPQQQQQRQNGRTYYRHHSEFNGMPTPPMGFAAVPTGLRYASLNAGGGRTGATNLRAGGNGKVGGVGAGAGGTNAHSQSQAHVAAARMSSINNTIYPHKSIVMARHGETMNVRERYTWQRIRRRKEIELSA